MEQHTFREQLVSVIDDYLSVQENKPIALSHLWTEIKESVMAISRNILDDSSLSHDRNYSRTAEFIRVHPHLYKSDNGNVEMRSLLHRQIVSETLESAMRLYSAATICHIGVCLGQIQKSMGYDFKSSTYGKKGIQSIRDFMNDHRSMFLNIQPFPNSSDDFMKQSVKFHDANIVLLLKGKIQNISASTESTTVTESDNLVVVVHQNRLYNTNSAVQLVNEDDFCSLAKLIDQCLEESPRIGELIIRVLSLFASCCSMFYDFKDIRWFIEHHPHLYKLKDGIVSRRSDEHRMVLSQLIEYLKMKKPICSKKEIFQYIGQLSSIFKPSSSQKCEDALKNFFIDHELLFEKFSNNHTDSRKRKEDRTCLRHPHVYIIEERFQPFDYNTVISEIGTIQTISTNKKTLMVTIDTGEFGAQIVYCKLADISSYPIETADKYQIGDKVTFNAVKVKATDKTYQWLATLVAFYPLEKTNCKNEEVTTQFETQSPSTSANATNAISNFLSKEYAPMELTGEPKKPATIDIFNNVRRFELNGCELLALEETRYRLLDSFIRDGIENVDQLFQRLQDLTVVFPKQFPSKNHLREYIENRPHLFQLDVTNQTASNTSVELRLALFDLLLLCQQGQSVEAVRQVIMAKRTVSHAVLIEYVATKEEFIHFLQHYEKIFELSELLPNDDRIVHARGYCDVRKRLFLPRWHFK